MTLEASESKRTRSETDRALNMRALSVVLAFLLLGAGRPGPAAADDFGALSPSRPSVLEGVPPDTIYVMRMDTLVVIGYRRDGSSAAPSPNAEATDRSPFVAAAAKGSEPPASNTRETTPNGVSIGGLTVNETFSVIGARFARAFTDRWTEPEDVQDLGYTITLGENPAPRRGAEVFVEVEGTTLFQTYLLPNRRQIQQATQKAVRRVTLYLQKYYEPREVY